MAVNFTAAVWYKQVELYEAQAKMMRTQAYNLLTDADAQMDKASASRRKAWGIEDQAQAKLKVEMAAITKCTNDECPINYSCLRYKIAPDPSGQSFALFSYYGVSGVWERYFCDMFIPTKDSQLEYNPAKREAKSEAKRAFTHPPSEWQVGDRVMTGRGVIAQIRAIVDDSDGVRYAILSDPAGVFSMWLTTNNVKWAGRPTLAAGTLVRGNACGEIAEIKVKCPCSGREHGRPGGRECNGYHMKNGWLWQREEFTVVALPPKEKT